MGETLSLFTPLHTQTKRDYIARVLDDKVNCMREARKYEENYWDGPRRYGYGGYKYMPGRWRPVAQALVERYGLTAQSKVLDLGCGKAFLLYELQQLLPGIELVGVDRSKWGLAHAHPGFKGILREKLIQEATQYYPAKSFDLVISLGALHNLKIHELAKVLPEIERVGRRAYVMQESFRDEQEWFNLVAWCLTAETLATPEDWKFLFEHFGYTGDYEFIYFQ